MCKMDDAFNTTSVIRLCEEISNKINENKEIEDLIKRLLIICCGAEVENPVSKILSSSELLDSILKIKKCRDFIKYKPQLSAKIIETLIHMKEHSNTLIYLVKNLLESDFKDKTKFIQNIWNIKDGIVLLQSAKTSFNLRILQEELASTCQCGVGKGHVDGQKLELVENFKYLGTHTHEGYCSVEVRERIASAGKHILPVDVVLMFIKHEPYLIEKEITNIYVQRKGNRDVWKEVNEWMMWSSRSPELFQIITSIFNQLLINAKCKSSMLKIISDFVSNTIIECKKCNRDFFLLYPLEYQTLVALLIIEPEFNPCKKYAINKLMSLKKTKPIVMLLLLSHFPQWNDIMNKF